MFSQRCKQLYFSRSLWWKPTLWAYVTAFLNLSRGLSKLVLQTQSSESCLQMVIEWSYSIWVCSGGLLNYTITWLALLSQTILAEAADKGKTVIYAHKTTSVTVLWLTAGWPFFCWCARLVHFYSSGFSPFKTPAFVFSLLPVHRFVLCHKLLSYTSSRESPEHQDILQSFPFTHAAQTNTNRVGGCGEDSRNKGTSSTTIDTVVEGRCLVFMMEDVTF